VLEEDGAQRIFEITQASTQRRLPDVESFDRMTKASMFGRYDQPLQIS
jgi:hypothetical protein